MVNKNIRTKKQNKSRKNKKLVRKSNKKMVRKSMKRGGGGPRYTSTLFQTATRKVSPLGMSRHSASIDVRKAANVAARKFRR